LSGFLVQFTREAAEAYQHCRFACGFAYERRNVISIRNAAGTPRETIGQSAVDPGSRHPAGVLDPERLSRYEVQFGRKFEGMLSTLGRFREVRRSG
jgi:hypothetical protein